MNYWPQKKQGGSEGVTTMRSYDAWNMYEKKQTYAVQTKINSPARRYEDVVPMYRDYTGGSRSYVTDRRTAPRVREHELVNRREVIDRMRNGWATLPQKTLAEKGFHMSNRTSKFKISSPVARRGGLLGKSLGAIAMIGINMLKKSAIGINKGARAIVDYTATKGVLGAARLGQMRDSKMLKPPAGLVSALSRTRHGRG